MGYQDQLKKWAKRRQEIVKLHDADPIKWNFAELGRKYKVSRQRAKQLYEYERTGERYGGSGNGL